MSKVWKCSICKSPFLGNEKPSHCPHCGVSSRYVVEAKNHIEQDFYLDPKTAKHLQSIMEKKVHSSGFFNKIKDLTKDPHFQNLFHALEKIDKNHAIILVDMGIDRPEHEIDIKVFEYDEDNLAEAYHKKKEIIELYNAIIKDVDDPYIVELLEAFSEVEEEHMRMLEEIII